MGEGDPGGITGRFAGEGRTMGTGGRNAPGGAGGARPGEPGGPRLRSGGEAPMSPDRGLPVVHGSAAGPPDRVWDARESLPEGRDQSSSGRPNGITERGRPAPRPPPMGPTPAGPMPFSRPVPRSKPMGSPVPTPFLFLPCRMGKGSRRGGGLWEVPLRGDRRSRYPLAYLLWDNVVAVISRSQKLLGHEMGVSLGPS